MTGPKWKPLVASRRLRRSRPAPGQVVRRSSAGKYVSTRRLEPQVGERRVRRSRGPRPRRAWRATSSRVGVGEVLPDDRVEHDGRDARARASASCAGSQSSIVARVDVDRDASPRSSSAARRRCEPLGLVGPDVREQRQRARRARPRRSGRGRSRRATRSSPATSSGGVASGQRSTKRTAESGSPQPRRPARTSSGRRAGSGPRSRRARAGAAAARSRPRRCRKPGTSDGGAADLVGLRRPGQRVEQLGRAVARAGRGGATTPRRRRRRHRPTGSGAASSGAVPGEHHPVHAAEQAQRERVARSARRRAARAASQVGPPVSTSSAIRALELAVERRADLLEPDGLEPEPLGERAAVGLRHAHMNAPPSAMNVWPVR